MKNIEALFKELYTQFYSVQSNILNQALISLLLVPYM